MVIRRRKPRKRRATRTRKVSAYNRFIGSKTKGGKMTMKQAAALWKKGGRAKRSSSKRAAPRRRTIRGKRSVKKVGRNGFNTQKIMKYIRMAALAAPVMAGVAQHGMTIEAGKTALKGYTGIDMSTGQFDMQALIAGWTPFVAATAVTVGIPKLAGIIRSL